MSVALNFVLGTPLAGLLAVAGFLKLTAPEPSAIALARLGLHRVGRYNIDATDRARTVRVLGLVEVGSASALVWASGWAHVVAAWCVVGLTVGFLGVTRRAARLGVACGCWGSLSDGVTGRAEVGRRAGLLALAAANAVLVTMNPARTNRWFAVVAAGLIAVVVVVLAVNGRAAGLVRVGNFAARTRGRAAAPERVPARQRRKLVSTMRHDPVVAESLRRLGITDVAWRRTRVSRGHPTGTTGTTARLEHAGTAVRVLVDADGRVATAIASRAERSAIAYRDPPRTRPVTSEV